MSGFQSATGSQIFSRSTTYTVQSILGQGAYGIVAKCTNMCDNTTVAIKTMEDEDPFDEAARKEVNNLLKLSVLDSDKSNIVQWHKAFTDKGHFCMVFEHLDKSLLDFMKERTLEPPLLSEIRPIIQQVASALDHLKTIGMIHADLKLDNVMLVDHQHQPFRVKVIDFGLAEDVSAATLGSYIQTRPYRSPEIILELPYTEAIDMWSLGIMAASMYLGTYLYPGRDEFEMMRFIVKTQGLPPDNLLNEGLKTSRFFQRVNRPDRQWKIKIRSLKSDAAADKVLEMSDGQVFLDMLKGLLQLDAAKRLTPRQVLEHPFITMSHLTSRFPYPSYFTSSLETMAQPSQQNSPATPACSSSSSLEQSWSPINPHPHTPSPSTSGGKTGRKRKLEDVDESTDESCSLSKKVKSGHSKTPACQFTSCSSQHAVDITQKSTPNHPDHPPVLTTNTQERTRKRARSGNGSQQSDPEKPETDHRNKTLRLNLSPAEDKRKSGVKRKAADDVEWHCPLQKNTNTQERKIKRARSGNGSQHSDPESPQNDHHNTTLHPGLTEAEDQGQSELTRKSPKCEDEEVFGQRSEKRKTKF
ncbi:homeodomain-interacting protein kinase 1-like isoform X1 [Xyrichtys novacula]|uniref:Homeodomain-interacting protein kinase 1-like isoform X1 n=1 Tax=Xyrichtys novacula TaxID=13765 RepID=A0AAV1HDG6_XYRNO|nr:homeodomain-interacting protein kinase 1-like isoform X1 [Xyrichtys novacula]